MIYYYYYLYERYCFLLLLLLFTVSMSFEDSIYLLLLSSMNRYVNHCVGKWHLGHFKKEYTPLHRGFKSHIGYWTGHHDYFDHTAYEHQSWGFDIRRNMDVAFDLHGQYTTDIITTESVRIIHSHNTSVPLFLYVAHAAVHSGNPYNPLPAPDSTTSKFTQISDYNRRKYAGK